MQTGEVVWDCLVQSSQWLAPIGDELREILASCILRPSACDAALRKAVEPDGLRLETRVIWPEVRGIGLYPWPSQLIRWEAVQMRVTWTSPSASKRAALARQRERYRN